MHNYNTTANLCTDFEWFHIIGAEILPGQILSARRPAPARPTVMAMTIPHAAKGRGVKTYTV